MFHKVIEVVPCEGFTLMARFEDGVEKRYDVKPLFEKWDVFQALKENLALFMSVKVDQGGYGISWNDELDLSCNDLYYGGV